MLLNQRKINTMGTRVTMATIVSSTYPRGKAECDSDGAAAQRWIGLAKTEIHTKPQQFFAITVGLHLVTIGTRKGNCM
jgi:hypothetical protein